MRTASTCVLGIVCLLAHSVGCSSNPSPSGTSTTGAGGSGTTTSSSTGGDSTTSTGGSDATSSGTSGSSTTSTGTGGSESTSTGTGGGGTCLVPTGACNAPDQCAPVVPIVQLSQNAPAGVGGVVEDGTYWGSVTFYNGQGNPPLDLNGAAVGATFVIAGGKIHQSATATPPTMTNGGSGTFVTSGKTFTLDLLCGDNAGTTTGSYTVSGKTLTLYSTGADPSIATVLVKQ
jgi:hypothetical protein